MIFTNSTTAVAALIGAAIGSYLTHKLNRRRKHLELKRDVLRRLMGYRWHLTGTDHNNVGSPVFSALNEIPAVFAGEEKVELAFEEFQTSIKRGFKATHLTVLLKEMARSCRIDTKNWNDELLENPFVPRRK